VIDPDAPPDAAPSPEGGPPLIDRRDRRDRRRAERRVEAARVDRDRRSGADRRRTDRRKRSINEYEMTPEEMEFVNAVNRFREQSGNRFPTARDILRILADLGYEKRS
jgi:hypothetical protein